MSEKKDKGGLGYEPFFKSTEEIEQGLGQIPHIEDIFAKKGFHSEEIVNDIDDDEYAAEFSKMVFRTPPGTTLKNWTVKEIPPSISFSK